MESHLYDQVAIEALMFASGAHAAVNQRRKYTDQPYIVHPIEVAQIVATVPHTVAMIMAAYLHDVVEDTQVTLEDLQRQFHSPLLCAYVAGLTNVARPEDGNRAARFRINLAHLAAQPPEVQTIKVADMISNTSTIVAYDKKFAKTYLAEKRAMLDALVLAHAGLRRQAYDIADRGIKQLENEA